MRAEDESLGKAAFGFIFMSALLSTLSFSIVIPVLPDLVRQFTGGDRADAAEWMTWMASAWGLAQLLFAPLLGALSDRFGRRPVLLLSSLGLSLDFLLMALAPSLTVLFAARLISGLTAASTPTAMAYVADVVPVERRTAAFGQLAATVSLGFMIGPALGGWLGEHDLRLPFLVAAAVSMANFAYGLLVLPESLTAERRATKIEWRPFKKAGGLAHLSGRLAPLVTISFLVALSNMIWGSVWVLFCGLRFGWSPSQMGLQMLASGLLGIGVQAWLVGRVVKRLGEPKTLLTGLAISAAAMAWSAFSPNGWWFVASMPVAAFGLLLGPGLQGLISARADPEAQGSVQGAVQSLQGLATVVGPPIYGFVFAWSLRQEGSLDLSGLALLVSAAFLVTGIGVAAVTLRGEGH